MILIAEMCMGKIVPFPYLVAGMDNHGEYRYMFAYAPTCVQRQIKRMQDSQTRRGGDAL